MTDDADIDATDDLPEEIAAVLERAAIWTDLPPGSRTRWWPRSPPRQSRRWLPPSPSRPLVPGGPRNLPRSGGDPRCRGGSLQRQRSRW